MPITLPPSLDKDLHTLEEEVAFARSLSPQQRLQVLAQVCRASETLLRLNPKRERVLALRDPLPASTVEALARLRQAGGRS